MRDALLLSSVDWDFNWQGQHEISARLADRGSQVLFVENTGSRAPRWSDLGRIGVRVRHRLAGKRRELGAVPTGVTVYAPAVAPYPWNPVSRRLNRRLFVRPVADLARQLRSPLIWTFLPTEATLDAVRACRRADTPVIYYCVSDFSEVTGRGESLRRMEDELLAECDVVFTNGETLRERYADRHPCVSVQPFGADTRIFDPSRELAEPADLAALPHPRVGYVGALHRHVAVPWLVQALKAMPEVPFVFVGPPQPDTSIDLLVAQPNAHFLGSKGHADLPAYLAAFDVCVIPYAVSEYTRSVVPTKLFEYLAMGRPVVSSALPELVAMPGLTDVVELAGTPEEFVEAIGRALRMPGDPARRRAFALGAGWDVLLDRMLAEVDSAIRARRMS